jgi:hypothetical protein
MRLRASGRIAAVLLAGAALLAGAELFVLALLAAGFEGRTRIGPLVVIIHGVQKPLWTGLAAALVCAILSRRSRLLRYGSVVLVVVLIAAAMAALTRTTPAVMTKSDIAVAELYVQLASQGNLLVGPYSRFFWHHPGPAYFYMQVPFYALSGQSGGGLYVGALVINLLSLGITSWVLLRRDKGALAVASLAAWLLVAHRGGFLAASPWTAHVPVLATFTFVVVAAAAGSGQRWMLPLVAVVGSFIAQCHVALVPLVIVLSIVGLAGVVIREAPEQRRSLPAVMHVCAWLVMALWLLPIVEQLSQTPGNLVHLWTFFMAGGGSTPSYSTALTAWSYALTGVLRPDLTLPYGGHFSFTHLGWAIPLAVAELAAVAVVGTLAQRAGRRFEASLAWTAVAANVVSLWSITRIHGDILDHEIFWIVPLGAANLAIVAAAALRSIGARHLWGRVPHPVAAVSLCTVLVLASVADGIGALDRLVQFERSTLRRNAELDATYESIRNYLDARGVQKPLFLIEQWDTAAAVFVRLHQSNRAFAVEDKSVPIFTTTFAARGNEDAIIAIRGHAARADAAGPIVVLQRDPVYIEAVQLLR